MGDDEVEVRFVPSKVEGLDGVVREVIVRRDAIELLTDSGPVRYAFASFAWREEPWLNMVLKRAVGMCPYPRNVGERDWCREPHDRFIRFFTKPPMTVYMPVDEGDGWGGTTFGRIVELMGRGGFSTWDLG